MIRGACIVAALLAADAGPDRCAATLEEVALGWEDAAGERFTWRQIEGTHVPLLGEGAARRFVPIESGAYVFTLDVADAAGPGAPASVTVVIDDDDLEGNHVPVASAFARPVAPALGDSISLDGSASFDDDADRLSYVWTQVAGPRAILARPLGVRTKVSAVAAGGYAFELRVYDGVDRSPPARVEFTVEEP